MTTPIQETKSEEAAGVRQLSAIQFFEFASRGLVMPFVSLYLVSVGFTGTEIGFILSAKALIDLTIAPAINSLADQYGQHRKLFYGLTLVAVVTAFGLAAPYGKIWLVAMVVMRNTADISGGTLVTQLTITWLGQRGRAIFGRVRSWGSIGWSVTTMLSGWFLSIGGYPFLFIVAGLNSLAVMPFARVLPERITNVKPSEIDAPRQIGFYVLGIIIFFFAAVTAAYSGFAYVYMQDDLGVEPGFIGVAVSVAAIAEIIPMILIDLLLKRMNVRVTLAIGAVGLACFLVILANLQGSALILPLMIARGTVFTLYSVSLPLLIAQVSHPANLARNQSIINVTIPGLAALLTGPISGWIFDTLGGRTLLLVMGSIGIAAGLTLYILREQLVYREAVQVSTT